MKEVAIYPDLENKNVLITGAMRGIGRDIALSLAKQKTTIIFNYRNNEEEAIKLKGQIEALGGIAYPVKFDLLNFEEAKDKINQIITEIGFITGLVNNAGISKDQLLLRLKDEDLNLIMETNLHAPIKLIAFLTKQFLKSENVSIINISSVVGLMGNPGQVAYSASKAGLIGATKSIAKELASRNIRANAICPGFIQTEMTQTLSIETKKQYLESIPLKTFGQGSDVANLVNFLLSKTSSYITGEVIKIDGGLYI
jgi:3-oxoacyl-[acyl-carrier protein] reductase